MTTRMKKKILVDFIAAERQLLFSAIQHVKKRMEKFGTIYTKENKVILL
jgi:hypothetical protein